jgi:hypothetical protein
MSLTWDGNDMEWDEVHLCGQEPSRPSHLGFRMFG